LKAALTQQWCLSYIAQPEQVIFVSAPLRGPPRGRHLRGQRGVRVSIAWSEPAASLMPRHWPSDNRRSRSALISTSRPMGRSRRRHQRQRPAMVIRATASLISSRGMHPMLKTTSQN
jgi:hypothetical protein